VAQLANQRRASSSFGRGFQFGLTLLLQAVEIPHYAPIANMLQMADWWRVNDNSIPWEERRIRPGDVTMAGMRTFRPYSMVLKVERVHSITVLS